MKKWWLLKGIFYALFMGGFIILFSYVVMWLWNWLAMDLFGGPTIDFVHALGILALSKILFSGFHPFGCRKCCHHGHGKHKGHWKRKWAQKMSKMDLEQKEKFKAHFARKCGFDWEDEIQEKDGEETTKSE